MPRAIRYDFWKKPANYNAMRREVSREVASGFLTHTEVDLFGNVGAPPPWDAFHYSPSTRTLADEIKALRRYVALNDVDPFHGWHMCSGAHCMCYPAPNAFRNPSRELLAMQAGKPAYGSAA